MIAIASVLFSTFTLAVCAAAVPMLFQRLANMKDKMHVDMAKFKV